MTRITFKPNWNRDDKSAPFKRNDRMLEIVPVGVITFPGSGITTFLVLLLRKAARKSLHPNGHVFPGHIKICRTAIIGIGDSLSFSSFHVVKQKAEPGFSVRRFQCLERANVFKVKRHNVCEAVKILRPHLPRPIAADIDPMPARHRLRSVVGFFTHMPATRTGGVDLRIHADTARLSAKRGLGKRRPANVAKADEVDSELSGYVFPRLSVPANLGISVRGLPPPLGKRDLRTYRRGKQVMERRAESLTYDDR